MMLELESILLESFFSAGCVYVFYSIFGFISCSRHFGDSLRITVFGDIPSYFLKNASEEYEDPGVECPSAE